MSRKPKPKFYTGPTTPVSPNNLEGVALEWAAASVLFPGDTAVGDPTFMRFEDGSSDYHLADEPDQAGKAMDDFNISAIRGPDGTWAAYAPGSPVCIGATMPRAVARAVAAFKYGEWVPVPTMLLEAVKP